MDRAALRNLTRYWLDDLSGGYFTDTQVNAFLNNAQRQVQKVLIQSFESRYVACKETLTVSGQAFYQMPSDFMKVNRFVLILSGTTEANEDFTDLLFVTPNQENRFSSRSGNPAYYTILDDKFKLLPVPDTSNKTLRLYYTYRVADMTSDVETPDVDEEFQEMIAIYAALDGFIKDGRDPSALLAKKQEYLESLKRDADNRNIDKSRSVVITKEDYGPVF